MKRKLIGLCIMGMLVLSGTACQQQKGNTAADSHVGSSTVISEDAISSTADVSDVSKTDSSAPDNSTATNTYRQITQQEAAQIMKTESGYIILDVRTQQEYDEGHIPQAICIPNEIIGLRENIEELPDKSQMILVYCRSGRRSKEAAEKLASLGYTNVIEFGGIITWTGPIALD